jgi:putative ABC transport system permease protein
MRIIDLITIAFSNLWRRKMRTMLTVLAVVIGATLVALVVSLGSGLQSFIANQFSLQVPQNVVFVSSNKAMAPDQRGNSGPAVIPDTQAAASVPFIAADIANIKSIPGVAQIDFYRINTGALSIQADNTSKKYTVSVSAVPSYEAGQRKLLSGSAFNENDTGKCLIAYDYLPLFGWNNSNAIGKQVTITSGKQKTYSGTTQAFVFTVVGVIDKTISGAQVLIPSSDGINMARYYTDNPQLYSDQQPGYLLQLKAKDIKQLDAIAASARALGFNAMTPTDLLDNVSRVFSIIQTVLSAFGIIALVVAGIGIINTLLMAIHERTREIGVMKAVGATRGTIRMLFTAEGGALGFLGGVIGCLFAWILGQVFNFVGLRSFLSDFPGLQMSAFSIGLVLGVIAITTGISLLAALYPAARAARLDPVEALRYE